MQTILAWIGGAAVICVVGFLAGAQWRDAKYVRELAAAKAAFEVLVSDAQNAYAAQKVTDDAELARLKTLADTTPANPTIALKKDAAGRVGAIK
jgi:hypothetical protein